MSYLPASTSNFLETAEAILINCNLHERTFHKIPFFQSVPKTEHHSRDEASSACRSSGAHTTHMSEGEAKWAARRPTFDTITRAEKQGKKKKKQRDVPAPSAGSNGDKTSPEGEGRKRTKSAKERKRKGEKQGDVLWDNELEESTSEQTMDDSLMLCSDSLQEEASTMRRLKSSGDVSAGRGEEAGPRKKVKKRSVKKKLGHRSTTLQKSVTAALPAFASPRAYSTSSARSEVVTLTLLQTHTPTIPTTFNTNETNKSLQRLPSPHRQQTSTTSNSDTSGPTSVDSYEDEQSASPLNGMPMSPKPSESPTNPPQVVREAKRPMPSKVPPSFVTNSPLSPAPSTTTSTTVSPATTTTTTGTATATTSTSPTTKSRGRSESSVQCIRPAASLGEIPNSFRRSKGNTMVNPAGNKGKGGGRAGIGNVFLMNGRLGPSPGLARQPGDYFEDRKSVV